MELPDLRDLLFSMRPKDILYDIKAENQNYKNPEFCEMRDIQENNHSLLYENECCKYLKNEREVKYLVHFTPIENIEGIMREGILPRSMQHIPGTVTDELRLDNQLDASDFSISFPNYRMFYKKWCIEKKTKYAVLLISIDVLNHIDPEKVAYFIDNAASAEMQSIDFSAKTSLTAVKSLFADNKDKVREKYSLPSYYTTNPQAEVQIKDKVLPSYIREIHVNDFEAYCFLMEQGIHNKTDLKLDDSYFFSRKDNKYWSDTNG